MHISDSRGSFAAAASAFETTHWSVVKAAGNQESPEARDALEKLCRIYWHPLYSYIRRKGLSPEDASDATQEFFCQLIARNSLRSVECARGSFRSFLLASVNHLLANGWDKARALKRGGGLEIVSLDAEEAEGRLAEDMATHDSAEKTFDRRWALKLLDRALTTLRAEFTAAGRLTQFDALKRFLSDVAGDGEYAALAVPLGMEEGGVAVAVHRLRLRYREIVRAEIAQTVTTESELNIEMNHLFACFD